MGWPELIWGVLMSIHAEVEMQFYLLLGRLLEAANPRHFDSALNMGFGGHPIGAAGHPIGAPGHPIGAPGHPITRRFLRAAGQLAKKPTYLPTPNTSKRQGKQHFWVGAHATHVPGQRARAIRSSMPQLRCYEVYEVGWIKQPLVR